MKCIVGLIVGLAAVALQLPAAAFQDAGEPFEVELVSEVSSVAPRRPFWIAVNINIEKEAMIPWRMPGNSLTAPTLTWSLPAGFVAGKVLWPAPGSRIRQDGHRALVLAGPITLLAEIIPPDAIDGDTQFAFDLHFDAELCYAKCALRSAEARIELPRGAGRPDAETAWLFEEMRRNLPTYSPWPVRAAAGPEILEIEIYMEPEVAAEIENVVFYPYDAELIDLDSAGATPPEIEQDGVMLKLARPEAAPLLPQVAGLVQFYTSDGETTAYEIDVANAIRPATSRIAPLRGVEDLNLWLAVGFALIGGLILNLMPCVFPVIAMKAFSLVKTSDAPAGRRLLDGVSYTAGILLTFLAVASVLLILKGLGNEVGWGFQLQSPVFVLILIAILALVTFNFLGIFELRMQRLFAGPRGDGGPLTSFLTGTLAVVVATPCTAPFMAPAVGFALSQSGITALATFTALGFGLAAPYLAISAVPAIGRVLPKPGPWMVRLRRWLALPVAGTIVWLIWVLATQSGTDGAILGVLAIVVALAVAVVYRTFPHWKADRRFAGVAGTLALIALFSVYANRELGDLRPPGTALEQRGSITVVPFSTARLASIRNEGRPVLLYFTATWCVTCLVNERFVLSSEEFQNFLLANGIVLMEGDWTNPNDEIARLLGEFGRSGIPFNVFYPAGSQSKPVILPELLTLDDTLERLESLTLDAE